MNENEGIEDKLMEDLSRFTDDPLGFVLYVYPWGEEGTTLADEEGPDDWQVKVMQDIQHGIRYGWIDNNGTRVDCDTGIKIAVASGHGIGKTALLAWLDDWFITCHPNPAMVTTANTKEQLTSKTWREKAKWHKLLINKHWFKWTATKYINLLEPSTWYSSAIPWSEHNPDAFAGTHEEFTFIKYDEASSISDPIWETTEGAMTDSKGLRIWLVFGNPTQATGRFAQCFTKFRKYWVTYRIDSRTVKRTSKKLFQQWADAYGDDSDFFRVRVKGQAPRVGTRQFMGTELVEGAAAKTIHPSAYIHMPRIMGVDIARFGDDQSAFIRRQGLAAYRLEKFRGLSSINCAGLIAQRIKSEDLDMVFLDMGNTGAAVYDFLIGWGYEEKVTGVWFGSGSDDPTFFNKRSQMWGNIKEWLEAGGVIPDDDDLKTDLQAPEYGFSNREEIQLERKDDIKKRGLASPDCGDALVLTKAYPVEIKRPTNIEHGYKHTTALTNYDYLDQNQAPARQADRRPTMAEVEKPYMGDLY